MRRLTIPGLMLLAGCALVRTDFGRAPSSAPAGAHWTRQYSIRAFDREVAREDAAAHALEAQGGFRVRILPTPEKWKTFKAQHPGIRSIWRYDFDPEKEIPIEPGESTRPPVEHKRKVGAGFVAVEQTGRVLPLHESVGFIRTGTDP